MKLRSSFVFIASVIFSLAWLSCASSPPIEPESLIGTKWIGTEDSAGHISGIMFLDEGTCRYVTDRYSFRTLYLIQDNRIIIRLPGINRIYTLKGDTLYRSNGEPAYTQDFSPIVQQE